MRRMSLPFMPLVVVAALLVGSLGQRADAVQDQAAFADLRADLEDRLDNELAAPEGTIARKRRKAVAKSLKALGKSSKKRSTDLKIAAKCASLVAKPFAAELTSVSKLADFRSTFSALRGRFRQLVELDLASVSAAEDRLSAKIAKKLRKQTARAQKNLTAAVSTVASSGAGYRAVFRRLAAAQKAVESAQKIVSKAAPASGAKSEQLAMTVAGSPWTSRDGAVLVQYFTRDNGLTVSATRDRSDGGEDKLEILVASVPGVGTYVLQDLGNVEVRYTERPAGEAAIRYTFAPNPRSTLTVDEYDLKKPRFRARFNIDVSHPTQGTIVLDSGSFDIGGRNVLGSGGALFN